MKNKIDNDTICAIATPPGCGGIAVARISGSQAIAIADRLWKGRRLCLADSHTSHLGNIIDPATGQYLDQALATVFREPHSYTGDDVVELSVHGSTWIQSELLRILIDNGARMAQPGEFTRRAFSSGNLDLTEAEAVADIIASTSAAAHRVAMNQMRGQFSKRLLQLRDSLLRLSSLLELELDFSEEDVEFASRKELKDIAYEIRDEITRLTTSFSTGSALKNGIPVAIVGATNAGKSTLLNTLLGENRAIVSDIRGTTRDTIEETLTIHGTLYRLIDTAGIRDTADPIEQMGIERTIQHIGQARTVIWVIDPTDKDSIDYAKKQISTTRPADSHVIIALNKMDLTGTVTHDIDNLADSNTSILHISAATGKGITQLLDTIHQNSGATQIDEDTVMITNVRHYEALKAALQSITRVIDGLEQNISGDFIAQDLREMQHHLGTITGTVTTPDILANIFKNFCVGK